jgi:hypothetical protein
LTRCESSLKANPDLAPLTAGRGRKLFDQNKGIAVLLDQLINCGHCWR